jgi:PAS domain-containing protein
LQIALALLSLALVTLSGIDLRRMLALSLLSALPWIWLLQRAKLNWLRGLYHEDDRPGSDRGIQEVVAGNSDIYRAQYRLGANDRSWRWVPGAVGAVERAADGKPLRMCGVQLDITEHKLAEAQRGLAASGLP